MPKVVSSADEGCLSRVSASRIRTISAMSSRTTTYPPMKRSAAVFLVGLLAVATVAFCGIGAMAWRQAVQDRATEPVKVHGVVTDRFSGGGAGKSPRLAIYFDDRRLGFIEGDRRVGEEVEVYRLGSGQYSWDRPSAYGHLVIPLALLAWLILVTFVVRSIVRGQRGAASTRR